MVAVTLKLMVIYILLRMLTIMMEDIISNKIVFFISKFNKDVEAPPVDCNVETKKTAKQSEIAKILEEIYMYISGIIVCIIAIFILVIQCPHPYVASTSKINHTIGAVFLQLTGIATRFIVENKYGKKNCSQKNKGSGLFKTPSWFSSMGKTGPKLDNSGVTGYINKFKEKAPKSEQSTANENNTLDPKDISVSIREGLTPEITPEIWDRKHFIPTPPSTKIPTQSTTTTPDPLTRVNGESAMPAGVTFSPRDTENTANKAREAEHIARTPTSQIPALNKQSPTLNPEKQLEQISTQKKKPIFTTLSKTIRTKANKREIPALNQLEQTPTPNTITRI
jgi:hypothetical protein